MEEANTNTDEHKEKKKTLSKLKDTRRSLRNKKDELSRKVGQIEGEIASEKRALKREKQRSEDGVSILLATVESFFADIHNSLRNAIQSGSFDEAKKAFKTIRSNLDAFIKKHKEKEEDKQSKESIKASLQDLKDTLQTITSKQETTQKEIKTVSEKIQSINHKIKQEESTKQEAEKRLLEIKAKESDIRSTVNSLESQKEQVEQARSQFKEDLGEAGVNVNKSATEYEDVTLRNEDGEPIRKKQILNEARSKQQNRRTELKQMQAKLENLSVDTSNDVLSQYENVKNRNDFLESEIDDLESSKQRLNDVINKLETTLAEKFKDGINAINEQFEHFFGVMFGGGEAQIEVVKKDAPRSDQKYKQGVAIDVHLPYKRINSIEMLSGGERALTSIALLFAITQINPPPFLVLDEMDAALDEANSRKYGDLIENLSEHSQLVLITHNRETMSRADHLYGITMGGDGVSQLLSVEFSEAVQVAKE
jgi:chromosome segregation protein